MGGEVRATPGNALQPCLKIFYSLQPLFDVIDIPSEKQVADLINIQGVSVGDAELLGALGVERVATLAQSDAVELREEMEQANARLELTEKLPDLDELILWIEAARDLEEQEERPLIPRLDEVVELVPIEVLTALPVKKEDIIKNKIAVGDVPVMEEFLEERDFYVEHVRSIDSPAPESTSVRQIVPKTQSLVVKKLDEGDQSQVGTGRRVVEPLKRNAGFDIRKTASPELNAGKKMHSRSYIRGVLHPQPARVKLAAVFSVFTLVLLPLTFVAGGLLLQFKDQKHAIWLVSIPAAFLVFSFIYLVFSRPVKCRVCGQPIFSPKACGRHEKSHRVPLLGYILPSSLHMLLFNWFRCMYCGTSVRLKK